MEGVTEELRKLLIKEAVLLNELTKISVHHRKRRARKSKQEQNRKDQLRNATSQGASGYEERSYKKDHPLKIPTDWRQ